MNNQIDRVLVDLNEFLSKHPQKNNHTLAEKEKILLYLTKINNQLKEKILKNEFQSHEEEINFFKIYKPEIISKLIFYNSIYRIEIEKPYYCSKATYKFYKRELLKIHHFFEDNREFNKYYRTNSKHFDDKFFVRNNHNLRMVLDSYQVEFDINYTTSHCFKLAMIKANDQLQNHLEQKLTEFHKIPQKNITVLEPKLKLEWTDYKSNLIELLYALHENKSINDGNIDIKELVEIFEDFFDIDLKDYYRTFSGFRGRKGIKIKFLDELKNSLINRLQKKPK